MRVESCGPLFAEPKEGDIFFSNDRLSEPITSIINPKNNNNLLVGEENVENNFLIDQVASGTAIVGRREHPLPVGFFLTDEEWSLYRQPDFGLVKIMSNTMSHLDLPKIPNDHSPLASLSSWSSDIYQSQEPAPEFTTKPQQFGRGGYSETCSCSAHEDEFNNNNIVSKVHPFPASELEANGVDTTVPNDEHAQTPVQGGASAPEEQNDGIVRPLSLSPNSEYYEERASNTSFNQDTSVLHRSSFSNYFSGYEKEYNPNSSIAWNLDRNPASKSNRQIPTVDTIGSHYQPIVSVSTTQGHSHHSLPPGHVCSNNQNFGQAMTAPRQENVMEECEQDSTQDYFEDWQSQSIFLASEVDKAKQKWQWHQSQNIYNNNEKLEQGFRRDAIGGRGAGNNQFVQQQLPQNSFNGNTTTTGRPTDDMSTLITFLSKFDDKVAAIWGEGQHEESRGGLGFGGAAAGLPYSESYLSTCSTPVSSNMYPWASPIPEQNQNLPGPSYRYDIRAMQNQIEQHQLFLAAQVRAQQEYKDSHSHHGNGGLGGQEPMVNANANPSSSSASCTYGLVRRPSVSRYYQAAAGVDPAVIMPPISKNPLSQAIRKTFGIISVKDDYHIVKPVDAESPVEEMENSLIELSHTDECSAFKRVLPPAWLCPLRGDEPDPAASNKDEIDKNPSELEMSTMQAIFGSLDIMCEEDEDGLEDFNVEVTDFLKSKPRTFYEQHFPPVDLLHSWTTHFTPIDIIEKINGYDYSSPPGILQPGHENDPNLPEYYKLFTGIEKEYNIFLRPAKTLFPIRFKLCTQPEKSVQTEPKDLVSPAPVKDNQSQQDAFRHLTVFDWTSYGCNNNNNDDYLSVSSGSRTPLEFKITTVDHDKNSEIRTSDWYLNGVELAGNSGLEYEYVTDHAALGAHYSHHDYCCDSGIGVDGSSRAGFYDDLYPEYDGVEFDEGGVTLLPYSTTTGAENDVDYGQFQVQPFSYNTWSTSSASGKTGKHGRRRTKGKPCKYFLAEGTCKRGNNCKFSHDLTTCRYWAEGSCLKGDACPYLHCFLDGNAFGEYKERRRAGKRYHLESDNDFPALGAFGNAKNSNTMPSLDMPQSQFSSSSVLDGAASSSTDGSSLLMLADPAGSMYDSYGFEFGLHASQAAAATYEEFPLPVQDQQQHHTVTVPFLKTDMKRSGNGRSNGKSQSGSSWARQQGNKGSSNNNWISSMISVKEKRKKKKSQPQQSTT